MTACPRPFLFAFVVLAAAELHAHAAQPNGWTVESPSRTVALVIEQASPGAPLRYRVEAGAGAARHVVLPAAPLGIRRADEDFVEGLVPLAASRRSVADTYELVRGKRRKLAARGSELVVPFKNRNGHRIELVLRAYDEGVAFRYRFPDKEGRPVWVVAEETGFQLPLEARAWMMPHDDPSKWHPAYEAAYLDDVSAGTPSPKAAGWSFPLLFRIPRGGDADWVLITEAGLDRAYCGTRVAQKADGALYRMRLPDAGEGMGLGGVEPSSTLPFQTPWRVIMVAPVVGGIVESNLVTHLAPASQLRDTRWIKPGRASWSWWSRNTGDYARLESFVDLAAEMGWEYSLLDAGWDRLSAEELSRLVARAKEKNVRLLVWYDSGVRDNVLAAPAKSKMFERTTRQAELARIAGLGIAGIKVDFFQNDKQITIAQYLDILEDAAANKLVVNFHGSTLPRGWERTYPHLLTVEAVLGAEAYRFSEPYAKVAPLHNTILPFTRNVVGPMDYTPVTFSNQKHPRLTSAGHELALSVVFESGIQHMADAVEGYRSLPEGAKAFLKAVPAAWDETRFVAGFPGKHVVLARRSGATWYLAGITSNAQAETLSLPLTFLPAGDHALTLTNDDAAGALVTTTGTARSADPLTVKLAPRGGFAAILTAAR